MTQQQLCDDICTPSHLSKVEKGESHASTEVIKMLYRKLGLSLDLTDTFLKEGYADIELFYKEFMFNEFDITNKRFLNLEDHEKMFLSSPFVLDYLIAKLSFNCAQNRQIFSDLKALLSTMTDHMTADQKYHYYLCLGIDALKILKDMKRARQYFELAKTFSHTGQLNYWLGYMHLTDHRPIEAIRHADRSAVEFLDEANMVGIISVYELMGLIHYSVSEYPSGIECYFKALAYTDIAVNSPYEANIKNQIAWGYMRLNDYDRALNYLVKDRYNSDITVNSSVTKFLIAYYLQSPVMMESLKPEFSYRNRSLHRMIYALLDRDDYFDDNGNWLVAEDEVNALFEFAQFTHFELEKAFCEILIDYYTARADYQKALEYLKNVNTRACANNRCLQFDAD